MNPVKKRDAELAERLWPVYVEEGGNVRALHRYCIAKKIAISAPTLYEMEACFGWEKKLRELIDGQFDSLPKTGNAEVDLLVEIRFQKVGLRKLTKISDNLKAHAMLGKLIALEMKLIKEIKADAALTAAATKALETSTGKPGGLTAEAADEISRKILRGEK